MKTNKLITAMVIMFSIVTLMLEPGCKPKNVATAVTGDAASKVYVAPGKYDEFYNFVSGGFNGQLSVYGLLFFLLTLRKVGDLVKKQNPC
jgi:hypothetical protein